MPITGKAHIWRSKRDDNFRYFYQCDDCRQCKLRLSPAARQALTCDPHPEFEWADEILFKVETTPCILCGARGKHLCVAD